MLQKVKKILSKSKVWIMALLMCGIAILPFVFTDCSSTGTDVFTMWLASGEQDQYYMDYSDNPIIKYLTSREWGEGDSKTKLNFEFHVAPKGSQADNFSNLILDVNSCDDVMALDYSQQSILKLYKDGIAMDLTEYILGENSLMPNYKALIQSDPEVYREAVTLVDGEVKILQICALNDAGRDMYQGLMYRRDWILRFGEMPEYVWAVNADEILELEHSQRQGSAPEITNYFKAKEAYGSDSSQWTAHGWVKNPLYQADATENWTVGVGGTRGHGIVCSYFEDPAKNYSSDKERKEAAMNEFTDNLVFPSGTTHPVFLSDWEWMFQTFENNVWGRSDYGSLSRNNAYMMSIYYQGTSTRGDFSSAFGGGSPSIYRDKDGKLRMGLIEERSRLYLKYMQEWYKKGWLDNEFNSSKRMQDVFYQIDTAGMAEGKIPAYIGSISSQLGNVLDNEAYPLTEGIMVTGAPIPINDVSGDGEYRFVEPDTIYQEGKISSKCMITNAAKDKNLEALLSFIDYLYTEEGAEVASLGFNKEQYEETQDSFYKKYGMTNGAYYKAEDDPDGKIYHWAANNPEDTTLNTALRLHRVPFGLHYIGTCDHGYTKIKQSTVDCWNKYPNTGDVMTDLMAKVDADTTYNQAYSSYYGVLTMSFASPITTGSDKTFNAAWNDFVSAAKAPTEIVCQYLQKVLDDYNALEIN